jgi:hypothetical protein
MKPSYEKFIDELETYLQPGEGVFLKEVIALLYSDVRPASIQYHLEMQPRARAAIGFLLARFHRLRDEVEDGIDESFSRLYRKLHAQKYARKTLETGKFTEKYVLSVLREEPGHEQASEVLRKFSYIEDVFKELRQAFDQRARLLEQLANNYRFLERDST